MRLYFRLWNMRLGYVHLIYIWPSCPCVNRLKVSRKGPFSQVLCMRACRKVHFFCYSATAYLVGINFGLQLASVVSYLKGKSASG